MGLFVILVEKGGGKENKIPQDFGRKEHLWSREMKNYFQKRHLETEIFLEAFRAVPSLPWPLWESHCCFNTNGCGQFGGRDVGLFFPAL